MIYHPLYGMNNYVLILGDWLSCDLLRGRGRCWEGRIVVEKGVYSGREG